MKSFEYAAPKKLKEATQLLGSRWGETEILAGGTDLITCLKQGVTKPHRVVSLRNLPELAKIKASRGGLEVGAMTPLEELANHKDVQSQFPSLITAIRNIGAAQIVSAGTVGGDLCQRPRCWYFRNGYGLLAQEGNTSLVRQGENRYHAIFATEGPALFVNPSSLGPALIALDAVLTAVGSDGKEREIPASKFFQTPTSETARETALKPNEILTRIVLPTAPRRNATYEVRHRHGLDWPYVTASVAFQSQGGTVSKARVILGHVAPIPWSAEAASRMLEGARINAELAARCGEAAIQGAQPLSQNGYKLQMVKTAVKRALLEAAGV